MYKGRLTFIYELYHSVAGQIHAKLLAFNPVKEAISEAHRWLHRAQGYCKPLSAVREEGDAEELDLPNLKVRVSQGPTLSFTGMS